MFLFVWIIGIIFTEYLIMDKEQVLDEIDPFNPFDGLYISFKKVKSANYPRRYRSGLETASVL